MLRRFVDRVRQHDWTAVVAELLIVVLGILVAFQVDRGWEALRDARLERGYLERIKDDLQRDLREIERVIALTDARLDQVALLREVTRDAEVASTRPEDFVVALERVTWRSVPTITASTYEELLGTGRMTLIRSENLRASLADYYARIEERERLGLGEDDQDRFRLATLGLLSGELLSAIEDPSRYSLAVTLEEAAQIAEAFRSRPESHQWLARLAKYQVLMQRMARESETLAGELVTAIERELER